MGGGGSKVENVSEVVTKAITNALVSSIQECEMVVTVVQGLNITNSSNVKIDGLTMTQSFQGTIACEQDQAQIAKIQNDLSNQLSQASTQVNQAVLSAINSIVGQNDTNDTKSKIDTLMQNTITTELVQKIIAEFNASQVINVTGSNDIELKNVALHQAAVMLEQITQKNVQKTDIINALKTMEAQTADQTSRNPIADTVTAVGNAVGSALDSLSSILSAPLMYLLAFILFVVFLVFIFRSNGKELRYDIRRS